AGSSRDQLRGARDPGQPASPSLRGGGGARRGDRAAARSPPARGARLLGARTASPAALQPPRLRRRRSTLGELRGGSRPRRASPGRGTGAGDAVLPLGGRAARGAGAEWIPRAPGARRLLPEPGALLVAQAGDPPRRGREAR